MSDSELDKETIIEIGQHLINQEFEKIKIDDLKIIENKINSKKNIQDIIITNLKPLLIIVIVLEYLIYAFLIDNNSFNKLVSFGILSFLNIFLIGILLFSFSEFGNYRKEHAVFSLFSPIFILIASFLFPKGRLASLNQDALAVLLLSIFIYFIYTFYVYIIFNNIADKLIGVFFLRFNSIAFNKDNTILFKLDTNIKPELKKYLSIMLAQFFNLRFFDSKKSETNISELYSMNNLNEAPMYKKLIRYYLFMDIDLKRETITFSFFKKYFDRLIINDGAIEKTKILEYFLLNICKNMRKETIENFDDLTKRFQDFDNELFGKQYGTKMKRTGIFKIGWLFNKYILITLTLAAFLIVIYNYSLFSNIVSWMTLHETLASGIIGALVVIIVQFVIRQKT